MVVLLTCLQGATNSGESTGGSGRGELAERGKVRKRGILFSYHSLSQILSEVANSVKDTIASKKVMTIAINLCAFRLMNLLCALQTVRTLWSRRMNSARMIWRMVNAIENSCAPVY